MLQKRSVEISHEMNIFTNWFVFVRVTEDQKYVVRKRNL